MVLPIMSSMAGMTVANGGSPRWNHWGCCGRPDWALRGEQNSGLSQAAD